MWNILISLEENGVKLDNNMSNAYKILLRDKGKFCVFYYSVTQISHWTHEGIIRIIISFWQMRNVSPGKVKQLAQSHTEMQLSEM